MEAPSVDLDRLANVLKALGHPARLHIYARLAARCTPDELSSPNCVRACVRDIAHDLGLAPATVSHHMKELRQTGLIRMQRVGQNVECWAEPDSLRLIGELEPIVRGMGRQ